jgi:hypothetical protein
MEGGWLSKSPNLPIPLKILEKTARVETAEPVVTRNMIPMKTATIVNIE